MQLFLSCDWSLNRLRSERFTAQICIKVGIYIFHSIIPSSFIYQEKSSTPKSIHKVKMPGLNNFESRQVAHDSKGLRVTVRIADDSTSNPNNTANDSTLVSTNINYADDLTSANISDDLTSASPTVVPIGQGGRLGRPNNVSTLFCRLRSSTRWESSSSISPTWNIVMVWWQRLK